MSYAVDKAIFIRDYIGKALRATDAEQEDAWRVYYMGHRISTFGDSSAVAEMAYLKHEGKPAFTPNAKRHVLPGGHPHEFVLEVAVYARGTDVFVGALFENRGKKRHIELGTSGSAKFYRLPEASEFLRELLRESGQRATPPLGFAELDAIVRRYSDDPKEFSLLAEKDPKAEWVEVMPRAAVLARWGPKGERAAKRL